MTSGRAVFALLGTMLLPLVLARAVIALNLPGGEHWNAHDALLPWIYGAFNDVIAVSLLGAIIGAAGCIGRRWMIAAITTSVAVCVVIGMLDVFFWFEFGNRTDRLVFHYLSYPVEVWAFLEDQFLLSVLVIPIAVAVVIVHRALSGIAAGLATTSRRSLSMAVAPVAALALIVITVTEPAPLRPTMSRAVNEAASNGILNVIHAALVAERRWHGIFPALDLVERESLVSESSPMPAARAPRHVMLIIEESFAGDTWWDVEARRKFMPNFDRLRDEGVYFDRLYATGTRTTRGLEALLHGYPPLPGIALNQRAGFEALPSLPRALAAAGFDTAFIYGGWPGFSNFANYWRGIGFRDVVTRDDFDGEHFQTAWGVADEVLFDRVLDEMDRRTQVDGRRVFVSTLTVSNHRPYDFPEGRIEFPADERRLEYAIAYADWALGRFMRAASQRPWYADTLFVIMPDHSPRAHGGALIPVAAYRVPGIIIWPGSLAPAQQHGIASLVDVPRTILSTMGVASDERFFGGNMLAADFNGVAPVEHDYRLGLLTESGFTVLLRNELPVSFAGDGMEDARPLPANASDARLATALFQSALERWQGSRSTVQASVVPGA